MLLYVHHVHYVVKNLAEMMQYLEKTFGLKPTEGRIALQFGDAAVWNELDSLTDRGLS